MVRVKERRRRQRVDVALPIKIEYNKKRISTRTKNISILGAYIETDREIPIGTTLDIKIVIPKKILARVYKHRRISCTGIIFRCHPVAAVEEKNRYGIGIFFRSFEKEGEKDLSAFIDRVLLHEQKLGKIYMQKRKQRKLKQKGGGNQ